MILKNVMEILKGKQTASIAVDETITNACIEMAFNKERAIAVLDNNKLVGILSDKDVVFGVVAKGFDPKTTLVSEIMTPSPKTIQPNDTVAHAIEFMAEGGFHHLPIVDGEAFVGVIYSDDIPEEYRLLLEHYKELKG